MSIAPVDVAALRSWLEAHTDEMLVALRQLVSTESPSADPDAQIPVFDQLEALLAPLGYRTERHPGLRSGGVLIARPAKEQGATQLLVGHCDTVWPHGTLEEMPLESGEGKLRGPGVYDMKAGLVQVIFALRALAELGASPTVAPVLVVNSDEETGSDESRDLIVDLARSADRALVMEPSLGREGRIKTARKGVGRFTVTVRGKAAHAGLDPTAGVSAILELSHVIQKLFSLNDPDAGITVNVGTIDGGLRPNVVAPQSTAVVDVRVPTNEDARRIEATILGLTATTPGAELVIEGAVARPPMERTPANRVLWRLARDLGEELGLDLQEGVAGGGSDGNFTSQHTATLDGLGAVGDGAHAAHEFVFEDRLVERTALLALLIAAPALSETARS